MTTCESQMQLKVDDLETAQTRLALVLKVLTELGGHDGAHHKDWAIDQAIRVICGVPVGPYGYPGDATNETYLKHVYESCRGSDGTPWAHSWDVGVAP